MSDRAIYCLLPAGHGDRHQGWRNGEWYVGTGVAIHKPVDPRDDAALAEARRIAMDEGGFGSIHDFTQGFNRGWQARREWRSRA